MQLPGIEPGTVMKQYFPLENQLHCYTQKKKRKVIHLLYKCLAGWLCFEVIAQQVLPKGFEPLRLR